MLYQFYFIYLIIYAGERNDFIKNVDLIFKSWIIIRDYYRQMNANNFEKWINEKLIPNCILYPLL